MKELTQLVRRRKYQKYECYCLCCLLKIFPGREHQHPIVKLIIDWCLGRVSFNFRVFIIIDRGYELLPSNMVNESQYSQEESILRYSVVYG